MILSLTFEELEARLRLVSDNQSKLTNLSNTVLNHGTTLDTLGKRVDDLTPLAFGGFIDSSKIKIAANSYAHEVATADIYADRTTGRFFAKPSGGSANDPYYPAWLNQPDGYKDGTSHLVYWERNTPTAYVRWGEALFPMSLTAEEMSALETRMDDLELEIAAEQEKRDEAITNLSYRVEGWSERVTDCEGDIRLINKINAGAFYPNLIDGTKDFITTPAYGTATSAYAQYKVLPFAEEPKLSVGDMFAISVKSIEQLAGNPTGYSVSLYSENEEGKLGINLGSSLVLTQEKLSGTIRVTNAVPDGHKVRLLIFPGINGQLVGCKARYEKIMLVRTPQPQEWGPSRSELSNIGGESKSAYQAAVEGGYPGTESKFGKELAAIGDMASASVLSSMRRRLFADAPVRLVASHLPRLPKISGWNSRAYSSGQSPTIKAGAVRHHYRTTLYRETGGARRRYVKVNVAQQLLLPLLDWMATASTGASLNLPFPILGFSGENFKPASGSISKLFTISYVNNGRLSTKLTVKNAADTQLWQLQFRQNAPKIDSHYYSIPFIVFMPAAIDHDEYLKWIEGAAVEVRENNDKDREMAVVYDPELNVWRCEGVGGSVSPTLPVVSIDDAKTIVRCCVEGSERPPIIADHAQIGFQVQSRRHSLRRTNSRGGSGPLSIMDDCVEEDWPLRRARYWSRKHGQKLGRVFRARRVTFSKDSHGDRKLSGQRRFYSEWRVFTWKRAGNKIYIEELK